MSNFRHVVLSLFTALVCVTPNLEAQYVMPFEEHQHEGTWLQWPHDFTYGNGASDFEPSWVAMTEALVGSENVHIIAYNEFESAHIENLLTVAGVAMDNVDIMVAPNDDFWVRDNGPIFVYDSSGSLTVLDWGFNGWGGDTPYLLCDDIPSQVGTYLNLPVVDLNAMVLEGGAFEIDGNGTLMATRSSITGDDRNPYLTELDIENYMEQNLGVSNIIWLDGAFGGSYDITDSHIDGFAKFQGANTIVTMNAADLDYWGVSSTDRQTLYNAVNADGVPYEYIYLPLSQFAVNTTWGQNVGFRSSYVNYYVANSVVLVPNYDDPNDEVANAIIQGLYPDRQVVGIDCRNILLNGGMVHCITQQQPVSNVSLGFMGDIAPTSPDKLVKIIDILGREITSPERNVLYLWVYESGKVVKSFRP